MRMFTAINFPEYVMDGIYSITRQFPQLHWVRRKQLHLTLRFIGNVAKADTAHMIENLKEVKVPELTLKLDGNGFFPNRKRPSVFWLGLEENKELELLKSDIDFALEGCGIPMEDRRFKPHVTLLRIKKRPPSELINDLQDKFSALNVNKFKCNSFTLYSSELAASGAIHTAQAVFSVESNRFE